jgi:N-methylhydantoinase A
MMYAGQRHAITVSFPTDTFEMETIKQWFYDRYKYIYGSTLDNVPIHLLNVRTTVIGVRQKIQWDFLETARGSSLSQAAKGSRQVFFDNSWTTATVFDRFSLPAGEPIDGPAIIEQQDTTTLVPSDMVAEVDNLGNLILEVRHG